MSDFASYKDAATKDTDPPTVALLKARIAELEATVSRNQEWIEKFQSLAAEHALKTMAAEAEAAALRELVKEAKYHIEQLAPGAIWVSAIPELACSRRISLIREG